ncbi:hypothetical protein RHMOL_Rhmol03G0086500 [Rhododendron molle]|uniref:Uncharacterized protein n=1 Tax=Rhododendron molle TaxID=49168 RepID=A0ACC0PD73_RHOML|nr:hypothetical protein RHMOL_Rhmol03G0086500 [Rhododendron molle]
MSSSYDSPPYTSSASASEGVYCGPSWECGGDDSVVGSELEAAEALAGLAHSALPTHRVATESPPPHSGGTNPQEDAALLRPPCPSEVRYDSFSLFNPL